MLNSAEARAEAGDNARSFYHIIRPEINFPEGTEEHDPRVYPEARRQLERFIAEVGSYKTSASAITSMLKP